jgi:hypothetical protein
MGELDVTADEQTENAVAPRQPRLLPTRERLLPLLS